MSEQNKAADRRGPLNGTANMVASFRTKGGDVITNYRPTAAIAVANGNTAVYDLQDYFGDKWAGTWLWIRCTQSFFFFFSSRSDDEVAEAATGSTTPAEQGFPWDANTLLEVVPSGRYLVMETAAAATLWISLTSHPAGGYPSATSE